MTTLSRRRPRDAEPEAETPRRSRRRASDDMPDEERNSPRRSRRSRDEDPEDEKPTRRARRTRDEDSEEDKPRREQPRKSRRSGTGGFSSYSQKRQSSSSFADEFKPGDNKPTLIKFLDAEPFDVYNQHWLDEMPQGKKKSFICREDEYYEDDDGCPLCDIGEPASTFSLFNVLDLTNPRKPEVKVWKTSVTVTDKLERIAANDKTSPLDRIDVYFEVEMIKQKRKTEWVIQSVKARDLLEDFDLDPLDKDELEDFADKRFTDRTAVAQVDSYEDLEELADSLDS